jgi:hypothetical protein
LALKVLNRTIETVAIVDDQPEARESYEFSVIDAQLSPVLEEGPLPDLGRYQEVIRERADALLCDHRLRVRAYASFDGAELVARCYEQGFPAVLCTRYQDAVPYEIRAYRERIPVLLEPSDLDPATLLKAFRDVVKELVEGPGPRRRAWRTQVHVVDVDDPLDLLLVELPGWHSPSVVRLRLSQVPKNVRSLMRSCYRCHAKVNIGAEEAHELYFKDWEER